MQGIARDILTQQASQLEGDPLAFLNVTEAYWKVAVVDKRLIQGRTQEWNISRGELA
ncbi:predicted protein, partial [Haematococcus lacustris]